MPNATMESVIGEIYNLTETIKSGTLIDMDQLTAKFSAQIEQMVAVQTAAKMEAAPQRRVPGALIGPDGTSITKANRYYPMLKGLELDGFYKSGTLKMNAVDLYLAHLLLSKAHQIQPDRIKAPSADLVEAIKALTSDGVGAGLELIPTDMADSLWNDFFLASRVAGMLTAIAMPSNPFDVPVGLGDVRWRKGSQRRAGTSSDPATGKVSLAATELFADVRWSYTLEEDSIFALMPLVRQVIARSGAEIIDAFVINADSTLAATGNINSDDDQPANDEYYLSDGQDGIRHQWIVDNATQGVNANAALTDAHIVDAFSKQGKYAVDPGQNAMITDVQTYLKGFLSTADGAPGENLITVDKLGPLAVVMTGQLAAYRGVPLVISASHPLTEADGKVSATAANNTKGNISIVNRAMWTLGTRRDLLIEIDRDIQTREYLLVASMRPATAAHGNRPTATHTSGIRNITL